MSALIVAGAFLLGAVPCSYLIVWLVHRVDLREHGSGNPGATNAARLWARRWQPAAFVLLFLFDAGKGFLAAGVLAQGRADTLPAVAGLAAVLGHAFSPFLGFRGGKGVATTLGVLVALEPVATAAALVVFGIIWGLTRVVAAGSLGIAVALPVAVFVHGRAPPAVELLALALGVLIVVRHRGNIVRMRQRGRA